MKKITALLTLAICLVNSAISQDNNKSKEVGLYFANLNAFGLRYKVGNEKVMFRITGISLSAGSSATDNGNGTTQNSTNAGIGFNIGLERHVKIKDQFGLYFGGELSSSYTNSTSSSTGSSKSKTNTLGAGLGFILGFDYTFKSNIIISAEIVPGPSYNYNKNGSAKTGNLSFAINNNSAGVTLGYRF